MFYTSSHFLSSDRRRVCRHDVVLECLMAIGGSISVVELDSESIEVRASGETPAGMPAEWPRIPASGLPAISGSRTRMEAFFPIPPGLGTSPSNRSIAQLLLVAPC